LNMLGNTIIQLKGHEDEYYHFEAPKSIIHNVIVGKLWIDHVGDITVSCIGTKRKCDLQFKACGWFSKSFREVHGNVVNDKGRDVFNVYAKWNDRIIATRLANSKVIIDDEDYIFEKNQDYIIWKNTLTQDTSPEFKKWKFSETTVKLIQMNNSLIGKLPKSDSRLRYDRIALQNREVKRAGKEKYKLEDIQRRKRKYRHSNNEEFVPKYFEKSTINDYEYWQYNGVYDKERKGRIKQYKKDKDKNIEYTVEFCVDDIDYKDDDDPTEEGKKSSSSEEFQEIPEDENENEDIELPEPEFVPDD